MAARSQGVELYRWQQAQLSASLTRDLVHLLRALFNPADPGAAWQAVRAAVAALIADRHRRSADLAAAFYRAERLAAGVWSPFTPTAPAPLPAEQVLKAIDATGIAAFQRALRAGATPQQALDRSAVTLSGSASRLALDGGRTTVDESVRRDDAAIGWIRLTDADPCPWCLMLAGRGAVFHSAASAGREKNAQFIGDGEAKWHDHCGCTALPVWDPDDPHLARADDLYDQWTQVTAGTSGKAAVNAWRRHQTSKNEDEEG